MDDKKDGGFAKDILGKIYTAALALLAALWAGLTVFHIIRFGLGDRACVMAAFMLLNAMAYAAAAALTGHRSLLVRTGTGLLILINIILTMTDQMGFWDYGSLIFNAVAGTGWFLAKGRSRSYCSPE